MNKENDSKNISVREDVLDNHNMNTENKEIENTILKEISQLKETVYQNLNSIERLEDMLQKYIQHKQTVVEQPKIIYQTKQEEIKTTPTTIIDSSSSDHVLMKKIQELESKVQTLTIEREMWRTFKFTGSSTDELHSTILMGEDELNESVSDQILELDKFI
jgi:hypothetical protein